MTNDRLNAPLSSTLSTSSLLVETRFIPRQYEPNYAYPLLVLFHARGGDEDQLVRAMPALSWRNYVGGPRPSDQAGPDGRFRLGPGFRAS
jgi:phospholipase/carboxylesterase